MECKLMKSSRAAKYGVIIYLTMLIASVSTAVPEAPIVQRADDLTLHSLQTVVEQQADVIQALQAQLTSQTDEVTSLKNSLGTVNSELHVLKTKVDVTSSTVAFSARLSGDQDSSDDGVALGSHQTVVFNQAVTNVGNAYSTHTGIFTAPSAGTYAFFLSLMGANTHSNVQLAISKNGAATLDMVHAQGSADIYDQGSSLVSAQLVKGDQVWVQQRSGDAVRAGYWTIFTGYLLQAQ